MLCNKLETVSGHLALLLARSSDAPLPQPAPWKWGKPQCCSSVGQKAWHGAPMQSPGSGHFPPLMLTLCPLTVLADQSFDADVMGYHSEHPHHILILHPILLVSCGWSLSAYCQGCPSDHMIFSWDLMNPWLLLKNPLHQPVYVSLWTSAGKPVLGCFLKYFLPGVSWRMKTKQKKSSFPLASCHFPEVKRHPWSTFLLFFLQAGGQGGNK